MKDTRQREVFARNLNRYMEIRGVEQADIVTALDITASTVSDWVRGKKYPRVDAMQRLADLLGVLLSDLTKEDTEEPFTPTRVSEDDLKFALFGDDAGEVTDAQFEEVKRFAQFVRQRDGKK